MKEDEWQALSADEQMEFIFKDSISTQTNVTAISGRGVGLDRVLSSVEGLGGKVKVTSIFGEGTRFEILLKKHSGQKTEFRD